MVAGDSKDKLTTDMLDLIHKTYHPHRIVIYADTTGPDIAEYELLIPLCHGRIKNIGRPTVFICEGQTCKLPITTIEELKTVLGCK